jgi:hypothetical protein
MSNIVGKTALAEPTPGPTSQPTPTTSELLSSNQKAITSGRPATRPEQYPEAVLWNFGSIKSDPDVCLDPSNPNRPPMPSVIRQPDGNLIGHNEYMAIRASGRDIIEKQLLPLVVDRSYQKRPLTPKLFKSSIPFRTMWDRAIALYKAEQPLLSLCANHWKAEHMLSSILAGVRHRSAQAKAKKEKLENISKNAKYQIHPIHSGSDDDDNDITSVPEQSDVHNTDPIGMDAQASNVVLDPNAVNQLNSKRGRASSSTGATTLAPHFKKPRHINKKNATLGIILFYYTSTN